jgi:transcriptional regulator with XRE-family HTH domain
MLSVSRKDVDSATRTQAKRIAAKLRQAARCARVRDVDIAKRLGLPKSMVSRILNGKANLTLRTLVKFVRAYNATMYISIEGRDEGEEDDED